MSASPQIVTAAWSMAAVFAWGTSDFLGGYATRRANAFLFATVVNFGGLLLVGSLLLGSLSLGSSWLGSSWLRSALPGVLSLGSLASGAQAVFPPTRALVWGLAAGVAGGGALAIFYRALSSGRMGLTAPVAAVLSAAIPTVVSMFTLGLPGKVTIAGFFLAALGLWLITRAEHGHTPEGIGLALLAGIGFAGFYLCVRQAGDASAWWIAGCTRTGGLLVTGVIVLLQRNFREISASGIRWGILTGGIDSLGTILFVYASQTGRLDEAVVISSLYPAITVLLAKIFLKEHFSRWRFLGLLAALASVPIIAAG